MTTLILGIVTLLLLIIYLHRLMIFYFGLDKLSSGLNRNQHSVSVVIPARNEAMNISRCLDALIQQNYPADKFEVIVINDRSDDGTEQIVHKYSRLRHNVRYISVLQNQIVDSPKKHAITLGIKASRNEIIMTTDADTVAPPNWIKSMVAHFTDDVGVVAGPVMFHKSAETKLSLKVQSLEFISLILAGMGSIGSGQPIIANGANLSYRKSVFESVDGFEGIDRLPSGDDDLFIQKVHSRTEQKVTYSIDTESVIYTEPVKSLRQFVHQRSRWASKGAHYNNTSLTVYLLSVYFLYLVLTTMMFLALLGHISFIFPLFLFVIKMVFDCAFIRKGLTLLKRRDLLPYLPLAEFFQLAYIVVTSFLGFIGSYRWKEK
ncbi:glycosyltransferase [candidate division KSB1 bacterium]|nr:glycosyltransferase [candidate division KSB1 bacterium]